MQQRVYLGQCMPLMSCLALQLLLAVITTRLYGAVTEGACACVQVLHSTGALQGLSAAMHITCRLADISHQTRTLALVTPRLLTSCQLVAQVPHDTLQTRPLAMHSRQLVAELGRT